MDWDKVGKILLTLLSWTAAYFSARWVIHDLDRLLLHPELLKPPHTSTPMHVFWIEAAVHALPFLGAPFAWYFIWRHDKGDDDQ
jgi:hypothetical protein